MGCFYPIPASQDGPGGAIRLYPPLGTATMSLPCGRCLGCRQARAQEWSRRCSHEASLYADNIFVTLTYDDEHCPVGLVPRHLQLFLKRVRKLALVSSVVRTSGTGVRFFACGEYGETTARPHYHLLLFNFGLDDLVRVGKDLFSSAVLGSCWCYGSHRIGSVTGASAGYVAKYQLKAGPREVCDADGVVLCKPFLRMSRRPGIGSGWLSKFRTDLAPGFLVVDGVRCPIPRAYRKRLKESEPDFVEAMEFRQFRYRVASDGDSRDPERLDCAARIMKSRVRARSL